jgi:HAD superfamily hydrolase (TIGR01509 family)
LFEAVIFDWDGTLADTRQVILNAFHEALQKIVHINVEDEFIERRIGVGASGTFKEILAENEVKFDETLIKKLVREKVKVQVKQTTSVNLFPGSQALLESLSGNVKIGLASMNNREVIDHMIEALDVKKFFQAVVAGDEVNKSKPDPEIFLRTAAKLKSLPEKSVVLEDSIFGVKAAKKAKMNCIAVVQGAYSATELKQADPDLIVHSLVERGQILNFIL